MQIFNTLSRKIEEFKPIKTGEVGLYTCGPTVYNYAHIGNLRTYVFEDLLKRVFEYQGFKVKHVMNITDVGHLTSDADEGEDKMEKGSAREHKSAWDIAKFYTEAFLNDLKDLNIELPALMPKATDHIPEQIALIKLLDEQGFVYKTEDGLYFDTTKLSDYGKLAQLQKQQLQAGIRVEMGDKKHPGDFALWKFSRGEKRQMEWESPWGIGFPGWHIECSAMATKYLGQPFDIHCGGIDHISVHHTNEIAQSEAAYHKPLANYWMHGEFLVIGNAGEKMAKSADNFIKISTLKEKNISPLAYRYFLLQTSYRKQLNFSYEALTAAQNGLNHLYAVAKELEKIKVDEQTKAEIEKQFLEHLNNDLDLPQALALVWQKIKERQIDLKMLLEFDRVFGLRIKENLETVAEEIPVEIQKLVDQRQQARAEKNWALSDQLRAQIEALGFQIKDTAEGVEIKKQN
jgi:cysteinyl-tRNA synthetase